MTETVITQILADYGVSGLLLIGMFWVMNRMDKLHHQHSQQVTKLTESFQKDLREQREIHTQQQQAFVNEFTKFSTETTHTMKTFGTEMQNMRRDINYVKDQMLKHKS